MTKGQEVWSDPQLDSYLSDASTKYDPLFFSGIYKHLLKDKRYGLTHNLIATKVMPPLIPQTVNPGLSMEQVYILNSQFPTMSANNLGPLSARQQNAIVMPLHMLIRYHGS